VGVIRVLEAAVADQIAAGEVVERPASVLKELVENSLDAGATRVDVDVLGGGVDRLIVTDDGAGMDDDDAVLCFSRHATSKLRRADDLRALSTFGFRGEALAAIASVARVKLITRRPDTAHAFAVVVEGGRVTGIGEAGGPPGTRVDVSDLFWNVPARRKFLKTTRTEAGHIETTLLSAALCRPDVGFSLTVDGKRALDLPPVPSLSSSTPPSSDDLRAALAHPARLDRVVRCLGEQVRPHLYPVHGATEQLVLSGHVVAPLETRRDLQGVQLSINGRPVADRALVQAVRAAFRTLLEVGRQPIVALDLAMDPEQVDVNVHPRKAEVRFADPRRVTGHLIALLSEFLATTPWLGPGNGTLRHRTATTFSLSTRASNAAPPTTASTHGAGRAEDGNRDGDRDDNRDDKNDDRHSDRAPDDAAAAARARVKEALARFHGRAPTTKTTTTTAAATTAATATSATPLLSSTPGRAGAPSFAALRVVGQVGGTYLVLDGPLGMVVIDQHAAHERVVFERLRAARRASSTTPAPSQPLLLPITLELTAVERAALDDDDVRAELWAHGIDVEGFSHQTAMVRALPPGLEGRKAASILRDALAELATSSRTDALDDRIDAVCARLACHAAVRAGDVLAPVQVRALLEDLDRIDLGAHCPHGRPVVRTVAFAELARWFDR
jgi:DNA mismatch repair protein MutL